MASKYVMALAKELNIPESAVQMALWKAGRNIRSDEPTSLRFHREVSPEQQPRLIYTVIEHDSGELMLSPEDIAVLRALLAAWDEDELPPGTQYITMVELPSGELVSEWLPAHDNG